MEFLCEGNVVTSQVSNHTFLLAEGDLGLVQLLFLLRDPSLQEAQLLFRLCLAKALQSFYFSLGFRLLLHFDFLQLADLIFSEGDFPEDFVYLPLQPVDFCLFSTAHLRRHFHLPRQQLNLSGRSICRNLVSLCQGYLF